MKNNLKLGVLGGMGTYATIVFMNLLHELKNAECDQENINMIVTNNSSIPDRTSYILGNNNLSPLEFLKKDIEILENGECNLIALTCNTAHYWYNELVNFSKVPIINMLNLVSKKVHTLNVKKVGLLATRGVIKSNIYSNYLTNIEVFVSDNYIQDLIDKLIYDKVKKNKKVSIEEINSLLYYFKSNGCDCVIFGCTELSVIKYNLKINDEYIVDSLEELAKYIVNI